MRVPVQVDQWPAHKRWSREYLARALEGRKIVAGGYQFSFEDYLAYIDNSRRGLAAPRAPCDARAARLSAAAPLQSRGFHAAQSSAVPVRREEAPLYMFDKHLLSSALAGDYEVRPLQRGVLTYW